VHSIPTHLKNDAIPDTILPISRTEVGAIVFCILNRFVYDIGCLPTDASAYYTSLTVRCGSGLEGSVEAFGISNDPSTHRAEVSRRRIQDLSSRMIRHRYMSFRLASDVIALTYGPPVA